VGSFALGALPITGEMPKQKIQTTASDEPARLSGGAEGEIQVGPGPEGNAFDVRMGQEPDGKKAAEKIIERLGEVGVAVIEANAPRDLLAAACDEAETLWEDGHFGAPFQVSNTRSMMEAKLWHQALADEEKVFWIKGDPKSEPKINALRLLAKNLGDFAGGIGSKLASDFGIEFDRFGASMLSCYTGDRQYNLHIDNPHGDEDDDAAIPDNGMRMTVTYYINLNWNPTEGSNQGGMDVFLTDPKDKPSSGSSAKNAPRLRVAPHADTLLIFFSERMAHQVISTKGKDKWFALTMWCLNGQAMQQMVQKLQRMGKPDKNEDSDDD